MAKRAARDTRRRIDWEGVRLFWGVGILILGVGALIVWASLTAPDGKPPQTGSRATDVTFQLVRMMPEDVKTKVAVVLGCLFVLFGGLMLVAGGTLFLPSKRLPGR